MGQINIVSVVVLPKTTNHEEKSDEPKVNWGTFYKVTGLYSSKVLRS